MEALPILCRACARSFDLPWEIGRSGAVACPACGAPVRIVQGMVIPGDTGPGVRGQGEGAWRLEDFEQAYSKETAYHDHLEHARRSGIPDFVEIHRYARVKGWIIEQFGSVPGDLFLDVGTGVGYMIYQIRDAHPGRRLRFVGTDISPAHLRLLAPRAGLDNPRFIMPIVCDAENMPFPADTFDVVTCSEVIEHVFDKPKAMAEMARVLKPGGMLFLTTPRRSVVVFWNLVFALPRRVYHVLKRKGSIPEAGGAYDEPMSPRELGRITRDAGLEIEHMSCVACLPHESYAQFVPRLVLRLWTAFAGVAEHFGLGYLMGLHIRLRARKPPGPAT